MRVLFISRDGAALGVAQRLALEGQNVDFYIQEDRPRAGEGLVNRIPTWRPALRRADLIIADCVGLGGLEETVRAVGRPVLGFSQVLDRVELDRGAAVDLLRRAGATVSETREFTSAAEATTLACDLEWGDGWVMKPNGASAKTTLCRDPAQLTRALTTLSPTSTGILQRLVTGVEISTECWFNGNNFIRPFNHTFEERRALNGGLGQSTACQGNIVLRADGNKLTAATVERMEPFLRVLGYRGPFGINCIVNKDGAHALGVAAHLGYAGIEALFEGLSEPAGDFLFDVAMGTKKDMALTEDTMIAVRVTVPPYPVRRPSPHDAGEPVLGITEEMLHHLFLNDIYREGGQYFCASTNGILLKATATGAVRPPTIKTPPGQPQKSDYTYEARRRLYKQRLDNIFITSKQYRTDIGVRVNEDIVKLKQWGWLLL